MESLIKWKIKSTAVGVGNILIKLRHAGRQAFREILTSA